MSIKYQLRSTAVRLKPCTDMCRSLAQCSAPTGVLYITSLFDHTRRAGRRFQFKSRSGNLRSGMCLERLGEFHIFVFLIRDIKYGCITTVNEYVQYNKNKQTNQRYPK